MRKYGTVRKIKDIPGLPDIEWIIDDTMPEDQIIVWDKGVFDRLNKKSTQR